MAELLPLKLAEVIDTLQRLDLDPDASVWLKIGALSFAVGNISAINHAVTLHAATDNGTVDIKVRQPRTPYGQMFDDIHDIEQRLIEMIRNHSTVTDWNERGAIATQAEEAAKALQALIMLLKLYDLAEHR